MTDRPDGPPTLTRAGAFTGPAGEARVTPEAAFAAGLRLAGSLADASPLRLAALAAANQAAGRLELAGEAARHALFFKRGVLEHVSSTDPADGLGPVLLKKGLVTPAQLAEAEQAAAGFGGDLFAALAGLRLLDAARSFPLLQEHGAALAARALAAEKGTFLWEPGAASPPSGFPLVPRWALVCDAARRLDGLALRRRLAPRMAAAPYKVGGRVAPGDLKLTAQEARLSGLVDGSRSLSDLVQAAGAEADALLRVALVLAEFDLLAWAAPRAAPVPAPAAVPKAAPPPPAQKAAPAPTPAPKAAPAPPPRPTPPGSATPAVKTDLASLRAARERLAGADHFAVLGVARAASPAQVKAAYFQLAKAWHPDAGPADDAPEARALRVELFARLSEAWGVLGDEARRARYLEDLQAGALTPVDVAAILEAENSFAQATVMVKARQYPAALAELEKAIRMNADEPEFHVWRAWVQFLLAADRRKQHAASAAAIEEALRKLPRCLPAYLFLGQMAKIAGDLPLAERHLKRGLALEPDDPDLARELRYLRK